MKRWFNRLAVAAGLISSGLFLAPGCTRATGATSGEIVLNTGVGEAFAFNPDRLRCRAGQTVRLRLNFRLPAPGSELIHNIAVLATGTDPEAFGRATVEADERTAYVPSAYRHQVIAISPFVRDGESSEAVFTAPAVPGEYPLVCTFPGHCLLGMKGTLIVE
jgi:azurin